MCILFFFNDTATTEIYTLSLHDALPISHRNGEGRDRPHPWPQAAHRRAGRGEGAGAAPGDRGRHRRPQSRKGRAGDRKSTRLNSSHANISYAVFCLKKKKTYLTSITDTR